MRICVIEFEIIFRGKISFNRDFIRLPFSLHPEKNHYYFCRFEVLIKITREKMFVSLWPLVLLQPCKISTKIELSCLAIK